MSISIQRRVLRLPRAFLPGSRAILCCTLFGASGNALADHPVAAFGTEASGPVNTIAATPLPAGMFAIGLRNELIERDALSDQALSNFAEAGLEGVHSVDSINSTSASIAYGLTADLTVSLRLPWVARHDIREGEIEDGEAEAHPHGDASGLGDLAFLGSYRLLQTEDSAVAVQLGFKAPTGTTTESDRGTRLETEFQPGTGSWDFLGGVAMSRTAGRWGIHANVLANLTTDGVQRTRIGDAVFYNLAVVHPLFGDPAHSHDDGVGGHGHVRVDGMLELNGETRWKNSIAGVSEANSGGTVIYLSPGLRASYERVSAFVSVGIPVVDDANGVQTDVDFRLVGGFGFAF